MSAATSALFDDLCSRGVMLIRDGARLRWCAPVGVLSDADRVALKQHKAELLEMLSEDDCPAAQLDREWSAALRQVRADFQEQGVQPSRGTFECAAWLKMELARGWPDGRGIDRETAGEWLEAMYAGKAIGRLSDSGRPIVSVSADKGSF